MSKIVWMKQQQPYNYIPLRLGLGYMTENEMNRLYPSKVYQFVPKVFTTRTRRMKGEYHVVEGSRYHHKPVEPRIEFTVEWSIPISFNPLILDPSEPPIWYKNDKWFSVPEHVFEQDIGIKGTTAEDFRDILVKLNKKNSPTPLYYISKISRIDQ